MYADHWTDSDDQSTADGSLLSVSDAIQAAASDDAFEQHELDHAQQVALHIGHCFQANQYVHILCLTYACVQLIYDTIYRLAIFS